MGIFKSNRSDMGGSQDVPIDQVAAMKQQGYSNNQIIQTLQRDGYSSTQIFDAISQAELSASQPDADYSGMNPQTQQLGQQLPLMQQMQPSIPPMQSMPQMQQMQPSIPPMQSMPSMSSMHSMSMGDMQSSPEELIEAIIEEKWNELVKDINRVIEWKQKADSKLAAMDQQLDDMQAQFDKLHQAIIGKIGDYDKHILEVGTQLQAMEKVFGKVLPEFIDNVNELSIITQRVKSDNKSISSNRVVKKSSSKKEKDEDDE